MVDFRRCITALAALALFAGLASAQGTSGSSSFTCAANVSSTPQIRGEGYTELVGDITLLCTGGPILTPGTQVPQVNITLFLNAPVTSRLIAIPAGGTASEALLLIDEPGASALGAVPATGAGTPFGPGAPVNPCQAAVSTPCQAFVSQVTSTGVGTPANITATTVINVATNTPLPNGSATATVAASLAPNVFQGVVSGNSVTWFGVPVLPPGTTGITRTFRLSNVRINATYWLAAGHRLDRLYSLRLRSATQPRCLSPQRSRTWASYSPVSAAKPVP